MMNEKNENKPKLSLSTMILIGLGLGIDFCYSIKLKFDTKNTILKLNFSTVSKDPTTLRLWT
jgi:hypothetical protein